MSKELNITTLSLTLLLTALTASSCLGTEVGNPEDGELTLELQGLSELPGALSLSNGITLDTVWLSIRDAQLWTSSEGKKADKCNGPKLTLTQHQSFAELISAQELPPIHASIEATSYCKLKMKLATSSAGEPLPSGVPELTRDYTIIIQGKRADGVPFELRVREQRQLWFEPMQAAGFTLSSGRSALLIGFELTSWFDLDALNALTPEEDGRVLIISDGLHKDFAKDFIKRFKLSAGLYRDTNADGLLQANELQLARGTEEE